MTEVDSYEARIFVGLREAYDGSTHDIREVRLICQLFVDEVGLCVTVTPTHFVYRNGVEPGVIIGLINYPRFPKTRDEIRETALKLTGRMQDSFKQHRISVWFPDTTVMIGSA